MPAVDLQLSVKTTPSLGPVCSLWIVGMSLAPPHRRYTGTEDGVPALRMVDTSDPWLMAALIPWPLV